MSIFTKQVLQDLSPNKVDETHVKTESHVCDWDQKLRMNDEMDDDL